MLAGFGFAGALQDGITIAGVSNHDVLIATAREDWGKTLIISVELADWFYVDVQFIGTLGIFD